MMTSKEEVFEVVVCVLTFVLYPNLDCNKKYQNCIQLLSIILWGQI